ncbi:MAG TPA: GEVED domain-containing protein [Dehalococcoidia bacterium]
MIARGLVLALVIAVFAGTAGSDGYPAEPSTSFASAGETWADLDCSGDITTADPLQALFEVGGLPGETADFCPVVGSPVEANGVPRVFGDVNCDGTANARDAVELLADIAGIGATTGACPDVGASVNLTVLAGAYEIGEDWRDYGDAPQGAPTFYSGGAAAGGFPTSAATGPSHETPFLFRLGEFESAEEAPRADDTADDGLLWLEMAECDTSSALLAISLDGVPEGERDELTVNVFADWNRDGDWDDAGGCTGEWALQNFALDVSGEPDFTVLTVDFPGGDQVNEFWMRVMLTDQDYDPSAPGVLAGETEDYLISGGQVFQPENGAQPSSSAQPLGGADAAGHQFLCQGSVVPHGSNTITFDFEQTTKSFSDGFRVRRIEVSVPQPTKEDGKPATGVTVSNTSVDLKKLDKNHEVENDPTKDGRVRVRLSATISTTEDAPNRLEGPFILDVFVEGRERDGDKFSGARYCVFYVDHKTGAAVQNADSDGFFGGPGRAAGPGKLDPKFVFVQHGKTVGLRTDALLSKQEFSGSVYDKNSVTVFGRDGAEIAPADLGSKAGIKSIKVAKNGRVIKVKTVKDNRDPPVERIVIRVMGTRPGGGTFWDYFRIVIIHERGAEANKLATEFMEGSVAFLFDEDEATTIAYAADHQTLVMHEAPVGGAIFDDIKVICDSGETTTVRHAFHGSFGFIQDYPGGQNSDVFYVPANQIDSVSGGPCPPAVAVNVTNFGSTSPFFILDAAGCSDKIVFSEFNTELSTFRLGAVWYDGSGLAPVPGGDSYRDPSCFAYDSQTGIVGSTPGAEDRSNGGFVPLLPCNATCTQSAPSPKIILPADAAGVHMRGLAVSPDASKIAWYRSTDSESQVWIGDFDPFTQTVSNHTKLTNVGNNYDPTWSPDGGQLAFFSDRDGNFEIYVMNADGSDQTNITNTPGTDETEPSWQVP